MAEAFFPHAIRASSFEKEKLYFEATVMRTLLPFEIFFGQEQVLPMGHKQIFSVQKLPTVGQSGPATVPAYCSGADIA